MMLEIRDLSEFESDIVTGMGGLGSHFLADYYGCRALPTEAGILEEIMVNAAKQINATIVNSSFHEFSPHGLSGVVVIAESHLAAHTWPEYSATCVDLFTCSPKMNATPGLKYLFQALGARSLEINQVGRARRFDEESCSVLPADPNP